MDLFKFLEKIMWGISGVRKFKESMVCKSKEEQTDRQTDRQTPYNTYTSIGLATLWYR